MNKQQNELIYRNAEEKRESRRQQNMTRGWAGSRKSPLDDNDKYQNRHADRGDRDHQEIESGISACYAI